MDSLMKPEDRLALLDKISMKVKDMANDDLKALAEEIGIEEAVAPEDADKSASKALADSLMPESPVVNTDVLTGPRDGLKNFLLQKSRDKESQS